MFLPRWHGIHESQQGLGRLRESLLQLQGLPLQWSLLNNVILPSRVAGFRTDMLDTLAAAGELVWVGAGAVGSSDGRISLYLRENVRDLLPRIDDYEPASPLHAEILACLAGLSL